MKIYSQRQHKTKPCVSSPTDHATASVLVMEDDETIRDLSKFILEHLGYNVTTCKNGEEAIELYKNARESGTPYLTVIIDLMIYGGMGGKDAAQHILSIDPSARLIVSSGNSADPVVTNYESYGFCASLPKPYKPSDMANLLKSLHSL